MLAVITLQPWFAVAGLVAISLPLWMHLYQRVVSKRVMVSSMRLVPETPRTARSRRKIKHWPLFLLRALGVVLLGLAFARPGLEDQPEGTGSGREAVVFVLDRSGSMAMRSTGDTTAWEEAIQQIKSRLSNLHPQSRARLFSFPSTATGDDWITPSAMRKLVAKIELSQSEGSPIDALREAAEALARFRSDMPQSLEIVGDLQRQGWGGIETLTLPEELRVRVRQVGGLGVANSGLSLRVRGRDQMRRGAIVTSGGTAPLVVRDRSGEAGQVSESEFPLPDEVLEIPYRAAAVGWVRREVAFAQAGDGLSDDDRLFDAFYVSSEVPVYLLEPYPEREAFLQATFFLQQALRPSAGAAATDSRFLPQIVPLVEAVKTLRALEENETVIAVPALQNWPEELPAVVEAIVQRGGGVLFFGGSDIRPQAYTDAWRDLLPVIPGETLELKRSLTLPPVHEDHPVWGGLSEGTRRSLRKLAVDKHFALEVAGDARVMSRYSNGVPLVTVRSLGEGKTLFVNASADRTWGDWPADGALFVPTVHRLASAVLTSTPQLLRNSPGAGIVGVPFDVRVDPALAGASLKAEERSLTVDGQGWVRGLHFAHTGLFELRLENGDLVRPVAVNFPPEESRRDLFRPAVLERQLEARQRRPATGGDPPRINMTSESRWWRWILAALAIVWLMESWLAIGSTRGIESKQTGS